MNRAVAAAIAVTAVVAGVIWARIQSHAPFDALTDAAGDAPHRTVEGRLDRLPYAPFRTSHDSFDLTSVYRVLGDNTTSLRDRAVAQLIVGNATQATALFRRALERDPGGAALWSDYAAALQDEGRSSGDASLFARALAASERASALDATLPAAVFNKAVALDSLGLPRFARDAYGHHVQIDPGSEWSQEARARIQRLSQPPRQRLWTEAVARVEFAADPTRQMIHDLVESFPQQSRKWAEGIQLTDWASAVLQRDERRAARALGLAAMVSEELQHRSGESFLSDVVREIRLSTRNRDCIAAALQPYKQGRVVYATGEAGTALPLLLESIRRFEKCGSALRFVALYYSANAKFDVNESDRPMADLDSIRIALPPSYIALQAQVRWQMGTVLANARRLGDAADAYADASSLFARLGETDHQARMDHIRARLLTLVGRPKEAWTVRSGAFRAAAINGDDSLLEFGLAEAALDAMLQREWDIAHTFFELSLAFPSGSPRRRADAFVWRALASWRAGATARSMDELTEAERSLAAVRDAGMRESAAADLQFARALIIAGTAPHEAIALLTSAIEFSRKSKKLYSMPSMLLERARLYRSMGRSADAVHDLNGAVEIVESSAGTLAGDETRDSFFGTTNGIYEELFAAHMAAGDDEDAFATTERRRARVLFERLLLDTATVRVEPLRTIADTISQGGVMLHYTVAGDRVFAFAIERGMFVRRELERPAPELLRTIAQFRAAAAGDDPAVQLLGQTLYEDLLGFAASAIARAKLVVIIPDPGFDDLPFGALIDPSTRQPLIAAVPLAIAPSANIYHRLSRQPRRNAQTRALIVADPEFDSMKFQNLGRLPSAVAEGRRIAAMHEKHQLLVGSAATIRNVKDAIGGSTLIHIAAHSVVDENDPGMSAILLTPDGDTGELRLSDIATMDLRNVDLVVLAGCRTASRASRGRDISSLATAFLAAGARSVIGSLWDLEDSSALMFAESLHREIVRGATAADAVRAAQLDMMQSDSHARSTSAWAAIELFGNSD